MNKENLKVKICFISRYDSKKHSKEANCIPFQLQKLFAKLQLKFNHFIETKELTKSFQWNAGESFEQQDVQEFCRVLFDAVEQSCRNSKAEQLISDLYEGYFLLIINKDLFMCHRKQHKSC